MYPPIVLALTGGSTQIEFAGGAPNGSSEMVNTFTGEFSYNLPLMSVPGPHGSGYPITLNYTSNMSPETDASWVGFGWNVSSGAVTRSRKGFADDLNGSEVTYYNKSTPSTTVTAGVQTGKEVFDGELGLTGSLYLRYNNYAGWSLGRGFFASVMGIGTLGLNMDNDDVSFSASLNPMTALMSLAGVDPKGEAVRSKLPCGLADVSLGKSWDLNTPATHPTKSTHYQGTAVTASLGAHLTDYLLKGDAISPNGSYTTIQGFDSETKKCYGYMYTGNAGSADMLDYSMEKEKPFHIKHNKFLSIPFSGADDFLATGNGVGGKFRLYHNKVGTFRPARELSELKIINTQAELILPSTNATKGASGFSGKWDDGFQRLRMGQWNTTESEYYGFNQDNGLEDEPYYFRFDGDRGGSSIYSRESDAPTKAWDEGSYDRRVLPARMNGGEREGRTSYIGYRTVEDMVRLSGTNRDMAYLAYDRDNSVGSARSLVSRTNYSGSVDEKLLFEKSIGEFALAGTNGSRYLYGLPVYTREERDIAFGVNSSPQHNFLVTSYSDDKKIGEYRPMPYASMYLLTEITTPDYVDVNNNGPDKEDLGGYTKFRYHRAYGGYEKLVKQTEEPWYKWRIPYKGLHYAQNSLSEPRDDIGTVNSGEKEVYYMRSIETKTHVAYFVTNRTDMTVGGVEIKGSGINRLDACQANPDENAAVQGTTYPPTNFENKMEYLEEIRLYAKDASGNPSKLLKTTHFVYDYSLMTGSNDLNSMIKPGTTERAGKLTLRYVWFESEDVVNSLVSPYEFVYQYPSASIDPTNQYKYASSYPTGLQPPTYTGAQQNPPYSMFDIDGWGNYQMGGATRYEQSKTWVNQQTQSGFDPAAWHLKIIRFPSGGELHVQYEQHDYTYVQNRPAMVMVPLTDNSVDDDLAITTTPSLLGHITLAEHIDNVSNKFYLDLGASFGTLTPDQRTALVGQIKRYFQGTNNQREKMHFRFRYQLTASALPCNEENIDGYASVSECGEDAGGVYIRLGNTIGSGQPAKDRPRFAAYRFKQTHNKRIMDPLNTSCLGADPLKATAENSIGALVDIFYNPAKLLPFQTPELPTLIKLHSYLRIPLPGGVSKKGGGVRVKRLLMYSVDGSLESGDKVLSGSEYVYEMFENPSTEKRVSSGVATNEPLLSREENSLIRLVNENDPYIVEHVIAGEDIVQYEGMLGESLLPAPSVGYSRIIVRSIGVNTGSGTVVVNPGFSVYDFLTAKDYPTVQCIPSEVGHKVKPSNFLMDMLQNSEEQVKLTQGYTFVKNNLHGITKATQWYGGEYTLNATTNKNAFANAYAVSAQEYEYFTPGEELPVMYAPDRPLRMRPIGRQTEVLMEARSMIDVTQNLPIQWSAGIINEAPYFVPSMMAYMYNKRDELYQHVTTKIIDNPIILKKVRSTSEGIVSEVENVVFDAKTGSPLVTRTTDGHDKLKLEQAPGGHNGVYYRYAIPAHMIYNDMGQYAAGDGFVFHNVGKPYEWSMPNVQMDVSITAVASGKTPVGTCTFTVPAGGGTLSDEAKIQVRNRLGRLLHTLAPGDLVEMKSITLSTNMEKLQVGSKGVYQLGEVTNNISNATPSLTFQLFAPSFGTEPGARRDNGIATGDINSLQVIRSGKDNNLFATAGALVVYGADITPAVDYAKKLRDREKFANNLNSWVNVVQRSTDDGREQGLGNHWSLHDQTLTWQSLDGSTVYDVANEKLIPFNPANLVTSIPSGDCWQLELSTPYLYCTVPGIFGINSPVRERYSWKIAKQGVIGSEVILMGWWDHKLDTWVANAAPGASGELKQEVEYTGHEQFGVNDDGALVWYDHPEEAGYIPRNLATVFRGAVNSSDEPTVPATPVPQAIGRVNAIPGSILTQVLHTSAQTFKDSWSYELNYSSMYDANDYEIGTRGHWRPEASYVYRGTSSTLIQGSYDEPTTGLGGRVNERVYKNAGVFTLPALFSYSNPTGNLAVGWLRPMQVEGYTEHGEVQHVTDILGLSASSRLGHQGNVQSISATLARPEQINFDSFEDAVGENDISSSVAHTGKYSKMLVSGQKYSTPERPWQAADGSIHARFWVRGSTAVAPVNIAPEVLPDPESVLEVV